MQTGFYPEAKDAYLHKRDEWKCGAYHPWELIEFYRGLMCDTDNERLVHLRKGYEIAMNGDVTMHVIGAVILGSILLWDETVKETYANLVRQLHNKLPKLGIRAQYLKEQPTMHRPPLELAKLILPFNFR